LLEKEGGEKEGRGEKKGGKGEKGCRDKAMSLLI